MKLSHVAFVILKLFCYYISFLLHSCIALNSVPIMCFEKIPKSGRFVAKVFLLQMTEESTTWVCCLCQMQKHLYGATKMSAYISLSPSPSHHFRLRFSSHLERCFYLSAGVASHLAYKNNT